MPRTATQAPAAVTVIRGARNVLTPHGPEAYPGLLVVKPDARWEPWVIVPEVGQTIEARGGETTYSYATVDGGEAQGFVLGSGDRATLVRSDLPFAFAEWRIARPGAA